MHPCIYCLQPSKGKETLSYLRVSADVPGLPAWVECPSLNLSLHPEDEIYLLGLLLVPTCGQPQMSNTNQNLERDSSPKEKWEGKGKVKGKVYFLDKQQIVIVATNIQMVF